MLIGDHIGIWVSILRNCIILTKYQGKEKWKKV